MSLLKESPFLTPDYKSERNILKTACEHHSYYLSKVLDVPEKEAYDNLTAFIKAHPDRFKSKKAKILVKDQHGDRQIKIIPLSSVFQQVKEKNYIFSPSLVAYKNSSEEESINSIATREFIKNRSFYKNKKKDAERAECKSDIDKYNALQNAFKIFNNSQSGAFSVDGTPINCPTAHTSLTGTCRCLTSIANLLNEQLIAGNRLYRKPEYVIQAIVARIKSTDLKELESAMEKYNIRYPSPDDLMDVVVRNSKNYWESEHYMSIIREFVESLEPIAIASAVYVLDFIELYRHNESFMREFFNDWVNIPSDYTERSELTDEDKKTLAVAKLPVGSNKETLERLNHYHEAIEAKYADFITVFLRSQIPSTALYDVIHQTKKAGQISDTDSSVITMSMVIDKFTDNSLVGMRLAAVITYFIRMILMDQHYQLSTNMNVAEFNRRILDMKNEFYFSGLVTTLMSKHYFAEIKMCEGFLLPKPDKLIKGVHLRNSKVAKSIRDAAEKLMMNILHALGERELLDAAVILKEIGDLEREVMEDIRNGNWTWLQRENINSKMSYAKPMSANYLHFELWEDVFAPKYGKAPPLPYTGMKIGVNIENKTAMKKWLEEMPDQELAERMRLFCEKTGREKFTNLILPMERLSTMNNIPQEVKDVLNYREAIKQNFKCVYATLEGGGINILNADATRLISDEH